ncbi:Hsp20/alpha crystallin family protein [Rossellomorea vietnamensis]|uniref:Hsp20/alpha crystallin family protein n=2 Tax=Rossellomorea TaxID=2837508 RepID=A0A5D4KGT9_9BACI|nr:MULTISPECIES: Hsp20/alpha crystallin family protein [Rossellomorea]TYR76501.1 Hsp20/alpha crystallin family protein [Rossellomorea vietnamensis]TYS79326.1 Hsp20/alpha crystallin family protein [Rossellomorea aquimaris]
MMDGNLPDKKKPKFGELMDSFFQEKPVRGILESIDGFFSSPFPFGGFPVELKESKTNYTITAKLPGVKKEQIDIDVFQNYVTLSVHNEEIHTSENERSNVFFQKQLKQHNSRTIPLPGMVDERKVKASYQDGLLTLKIGKLKGKKVEL